MTNVYPGSSGGRDLGKRLGSVYSEHDDRVVNYSPTGLHNFRGHAGYRNSIGSHHRGGSASYSHTVLANLGFRHPADNMRKFGNKAKNTRKTNRARGYYSQSGRGASSVPIDDDEDMGDATQSRNRRFNPYMHGRSSVPYHGVAHNPSQFKRRSGSNRNRGGYDNVDRYSKLCGGPEAWFKVTIPHGGKETEEFLLSNLLNLTEHPFVPKQYHTEGNNAVFHIQGSQAATALKACSRRITNARGFKIVVVVNPSEAPVTERVTPEVLEKLKICMSKRYDPSLKSLNLSAMEKDPDLNNENIRLAFGKSAVMKEVFSIIEQNIPELEALDLRENRLGYLSILEKYFPQKAPNVNKLNLGNNLIRNVSELSQIAKVPLVELTLEGNPLCEQFRNKESYVSAIRKKFPKLQILDGQDLPPVISFEVSDTVSLPVSQGSFLGTNEQVRTTVTKFVEQYFAVYDSADRQGLLEAYMDESIFSLVCVRNDSPTTSRMSSLNDYFERSHNLLRTSSGHHSSKTKYGRMSIVSLHSELPRTEHDMRSVLVDIHLLSPVMLVFSVQGVFREPDSTTNRDRQAIRGFNRLFVVVPKGPGMAIMNEQYSIGNATAQQIKKAFQAPVNIPVTHTAPTLTPEEKQLMTVEFSKKSGMNTDWSARCLQDNNWNFDAAAKIFTNLQAEGKIPPEAFVAV